MVEKNVSIKTKTKFFDRLKNSKLLSLSFSKPKPKIVEPESVNLPIKI